MQDEKVIRTRDFLFVPMLLWASLVMWGELLGLPGWTSWILYILLVVNAGAIFYFIKLTSLEALAYAKLPIICVCLMMASSLGRFVYAMATGN